MEEHHASAHGPAVEGEAAYSTLSCPAFLAADLPITKEHFVDFEEREEVGEEAEELGVEEVGVLGYKCGVVECGKVVLVSRWAANAINFITFITIITINTSITFITFITVITFITSTTLTLLPLGSPRPWWP